MLDAKQHFEGELSMIRQYVAWARHGVATSWSLVAAVAPFREQDDHLRVLKAADDPVEGVVAEHVWYELTTENAVNDV